MRVLLINPTDGPESEYGALAKMGTELPQLGLAAVATALTTAGHKAEILDAHIQGLNADGLIERVRRDGIQMVGFSTYITTEKRTIHYAEALRKHCPGVVVVVGGPQVTLVPHRFRVSAIDYVFVGEADESVVELVAALESGEPSRPIPGVIANAAPDAAPPPLRLVADLDALPLVELDTLYPLDRFYPPVDIRGERFVNLVSTRGCPYKCTFCAAAEVNGRRVRGLSPARFVDQVEHYVSKGIASFIFYDDTFTVNKKRATEICKIIIERKLAIQWKCFTRVDCLSPEMLKWMREAGCYYVMFGCESMNPATLSFLKKGFTVEQCYDGIRMAHDAGMVTSSSFMIGLPHETEDDIRNTIARVLETELDLALFPVFEPYEGTPIHEECKRAGDWVKDGQYANKLLKDQGEVWIPHSCSREAIERLSGAAFRAFYLRPRSFLRMGKMMVRLPIHRQMRMISGALDYFVLKPSKTQEKQVGSRYH